MTEINEAVYLARSDTGHYKIGRSKYPIERVKHFDTIMPVGVEIIHYFLTDNSQEAEAILHDFNKDYRIKGEWFELPDERVWVFISICGYGEKTWYHDEVLVNLLKESSRIHHEIREHIERNS